MRFLRDRSISFKLALSAGCALLMLAGLAWCAQRSIDVLGSVQQRVSRAAAAEREIEPGTAGCRTYTPRVSRELQTTQALSNIGQILAQIDDAATAAPAILQGVEARGDPACGEVDEQGRAGRVGQVHRGTARGSGSSPGPDHYTAETPCGD